MRLDRFVTLTVVAPCCRALRRLSLVGSWTADRDRSLPVLMYHSISENLDEARSGYHQTVTHPSVFARQMAWLKQNGWSGVSLRAGLEWLNGTCDVRNAPCEVPQLAACGDGPGEPNPESRIPSPAPPISDFGLSASVFPLRPVAITFDDGFRDFLTAAVPVLQRHSFTATAYLPTAFIGTRAESRRTFSPKNGSCQVSRRDCLTWSEVRELHAAGIEFGSHTATHPRLVELDWSRIRRELTESKAELEEQLGVSVPAFAYPFAFPQGRPGFATLFCQILAEVGYQTNATTCVGRVSRKDNLLCLKRLPVNSLDDGRFLRAKLEGAYDWLAVPQRLRKILRPVPMFNRQSHS